MIPPPPPVAITLSSTPSTGRITGRALLSDAAIIRPLLDEAYRLDPAEIATPDPAATQRRRTRPETIGAPDWHNDRAALLLDIEEALEHASDTTRAALIVRLRKAIPE